MCLLKLVMVSFLILLSMASYVSAQTKPLVGQDPVANFHQVSSDETLWRIATNNALDGISVWQSLISIYKLNLHAFVNNDISQLRVRSNLLLPTENQITSLSPAQAKLAFEQLLSGNGLPINKYQPLGVEHSGVLQQQAHHVLNGETLWRIATNSSLADASVWQTLISIYQLNLHAFLKGDISKLRLGSRLVIPTLDQMTRLSPDAAELIYKQLMGASLTSVTTMHSKGLKQKKLPMQAKAKTEVGVNASAAEKINQNGSKKAPLKSNLKPVLATFILQEVTIIGNESFSTQTLLALLADAVGTAQNIPELRQLVARITQFYQDQGYSFVRAILPAQAITQGNVTVQVIEAKYGQIDITNNSSVSDALLTAATSSIKAGTVISDANLYTLLSDIPGLAVTSSLSPGYKSGSSNITFVIEDSQSYSGSFSVDQYGDASMGKERISGNLAVNNLAGHGDVLTASSMFSSADMQFGMLTYDWLLNGDGTHLGAAYSMLDYSLVKSQADGTARTGSVWIKHPFIYSLDENLSVQLQYDVNQLKDRIGNGGASSKTDRTITSTSLTIIGDQQNTYGRGGLRSWSLGLTSGELGFDNGAAESYDAGTNATKGHFAKINLNINHLQRISDKTGVYLSADAQWANHNLDSSNKLAAGGFNVVRAYDSGALSGDIGYVGSAEYRYFFSPTFDGRLTGSLFYDTAYITVNKDPWQGLTGANSTTISGAGVALDWTGPKQVSANLVLATPTDTASTLTASRPSHKVWFNMKKGF